MVKDIFKFTRANKAKLKNYGFIETDKGYRYDTAILDGQFTLFVDITENGEVSAKVIDVKSQDEYILHLIEGSAGEFVGKVKADFERVLTDIRDNCFEKDIFKSQQAKQVIEYIRTRYGDELEFLWEKLSTTAVWRRKDNKKWYGILFVLPKSKLGVNSDEVVEIIDLRIDPSEIKEVVDNKHYFAGYHMNKNSWFTICLDNSVPTKTVFDWIDKSYKLALKK